MITMNINWKVRFCNKNFWLAFIPAILVLIQAVGAVFGIQIDLTEIQQNILDVVNAVFIVLTIIGVVNDPTTKTLNDSKQAMTYTTPN